MLVSAQVKSSPGAWIIAERKQLKCHVVLGLSALKREFINSAVHNENSHNSQWKYLQCIHNAIHSEL